MVEFRKKFPTGCNMAFKKELLDRIGGFNTDLVYRGDDKYIFFKLKDFLVQIVQDKFTLLDRLL